MMEARAVERIDETPADHQPGKNRLLDRGPGVPARRGEIDERRRASRASRAGTRRRSQLREDRSVRRPDRSMTALEDFLQSTRSAIFRRCCAAAIRLIPGHRLSREILATLIANDIVNRMGPAFVKRIAAGHRRDIVTIARAYIVARKSARRARSGKRSNRSTTRFRPAAASHDVRSESRTAPCCYWLIDRFGDDLESWRSRTPEARHERVYTRPEIVCRLGQGTPAESDRNLHGDGRPGITGSEWPAAADPRRLDIADLAIVHKRDTLETAQMYRAAEQRWTSSGCTISRRPAGGRALAGHGAQQSARGLLRMRRDLAASC